MGLIAIYPAAVIPIIVMGVVLGLGKITGTVWLKQNWTYAPWFLRAYILPAVIVLMIITSLGVFGFLSKAHSDQSLVSGDVQSKILVYDTKIQTAKENIDANRKALKQMDEAVDQVMGRSSDEKGADKAVAVRRSQQKERARLQSEIAAEQKAIASLNEEAAPIRAEVRKVEAEVGPIKYIAHLLYGENPDANILEKAVIWVTVLIVIVLDPLAVILLLASQFSFQRFRQLAEEENKPEPVNAEGDSPAGPTVDVVISDTTVTEPVGVVAQEVAAVVPEAVIVEEPVSSDLSSGERFGIPVVETIVEEPVVEETVDDDAIIIDEAIETEKAAMKAWKADHPDSSLKQQRKLFDLGIIQQLPWDEYLKPQADFADEAAEEAAKWAEEQRELKSQEAAAALDIERPGDYVTKPVETYMENVDGHQVKKVIEGYTQNAEQNETTIWNRVKQAKE